MKDSTNRIEGKVDSRVALERLRQRMVERLLARGRGVSVGYRPMGNRHKTAPTGDPSAA